MSREDSLRIFSPEGAIGTPRVERAASPQVLAGLRLRVLDNGKPGADVLLQRTAERIVQRAGAVLKGVVRKGSAATPCEEDLLGDLTEGADLVLTGTGD